MNSTEKCPYDLKPIESIMSGPRCNFNDKTLSSWCFALHVFLYVHYADLQIVKRYNVYISFNCHNCLIVPGQPWRMGLHVEWLC